MDNSNNNNIFPYRNIWPRIAATSFIAPNATVIGDVDVASKASIWFGCVLRGDVQPIKIGKNSNIQDGAILHATSGVKPTLIGRGVTVGHQAILHGCELEDGSFVGMQACVMDGVIVSSGAMVAAGALVTPGKHIKKGELWGGSPARMMRKLSSKEFANIKDTEVHYVELASVYQNGLFPK